MRLAVVLFVLAGSGCGPVLLGHADPASDGGSAAAPTPPSDPTSAGADAPTLAVDAATDTPEDTDADAGAAQHVAVIVTVQGTECGKCFEVAAIAYGGQPPYELAWSDGSSAEKRTLCADPGPIYIGVVARDANAAGSEVYWTSLQSDATTGCPQPPPAPMLCLENPSLEGTPAVNTGAPDGFDAPPWNACGTNTANTPDVTNETIGQNYATAPKPVDGLTYLALGEDEQASQTLCAAAPAGTEFSVELSLSRINIGEGVVPETEAVFLEIWGGLAANCSQRDLLWASPALTVGWKRYCFTFETPAFMDQITLRANSDKTLLSPAYLLVDQLTPVAACP